MTDVLVLLSTCADEAEAERIGAALVEEGLAACVNIVPGVRSLYRWQGKLERASEVLLLIKTTAQSSLKLTGRLMDLHSYDTPEVLILPVEGGAERYLSWVREQVSPDN